MARPDLHNADEIETMVRRFYGDVAQDDLLGPLFNDVAQVDWSAHLPTLTQFWCRALLDESGYSGNPFSKHAAVHRQSPFTHDHFTRWLELFVGTVDDGWFGPRAQRAKELAHQVADVHETQLNRRHPIIIGS